MAAPGSESGAGAGAGLDALAILLDGAEALQPQPAPGDGGGGVAAPPASSPSPNSRYLDLSLCWLAVIHTPYWEAIQARDKRVEFRSPRQKIPFLQGMHLLFSLKAEGRRRGRTELLAARVREIVVLTCAQAIARFPREARDCNLKSLCMATHTVQCP